MAKIAQVDNDAMNRLYAGELNKIAADGPEDPQAFASLTLWALGLTL